MSIQSVLKRLFVIPGDNCPICGRVLFSKGVFVCENCEKKLQENNGPVCGHCGRPLLDEKLTVCRPCQRLAAPSDGGFAWLIYDRYAARMISGFKFRGMRDLAVWAGKQTAGAAAAEALPWLSDADAFVPVPLHKNREHERGYNQSRLIAEGIAEITGKPVWDDVLVRGVDTPHQVGTDAAFRLANVKGAFRAVNGGKIAGRKLVLIDDVMTTGATLNACAEALRQAGADRIDTMTVAATL